MSFLTPDDLAPFAEIESAKANAMIEDAEAMAALAAPCITTNEFLADDGKRASLRAILRGAILRWHEAGTGAIASENRQAGPFGQTTTLDTRQQRRSMFWPSEISQLRDLCSSTSGEAFAIDTAPSGAMSPHAAICSVHFGVPWCSCGAALTGDGPLYERDY